MADKKITELTEMGTGVLAANDVFAVVDITTGETKKIQAQFLDEQITTAYTRTLLDDASAAAARTTLGVGDLGTLPIAAMADLKHLLYPSVSGGYGELYLNGWKPIGFNQQWGGPWGGDRPNGDGNQEWFPTGYVDVSTVQNLGTNAANTWQAQGFKVPETIAADAVWLMLGKTGDPQKDAEPLVVYICPDSGGEPDEANPITNGTMDTMDGQGFSGESMASASEPWPIVSIADVPGAWYRFTDASGSFSLTKNTQYYVVVKTTGADNLNFFQWGGKNSGSNSYPHGNHWDGDDATPANWTEDTSWADSFLIESSSGTDLLQSGGVFGGMLEFGEGTPSNESRCIQRPLKDFFDDEEFTMRTVTKALTASKSLLDINYGLLHKDRILLRVDGSNHLVLTVYESDATTHTITGTTDVTTAATHDIMFSVRMQADGADTVKLKLAGADEGTQLDTKTITISPLLKKIGSITLGGGFPVAPTWTKDFKTDQFANGNKPSNDGDTSAVVAGAASDANTFLVVNNDTLWMNYATTEPVNDSAYYDCDPTFVAATGGVAAYLIHPQKVVNTAGEAGLTISVVDGTNRIECFIHEYYLEVGSTYVQHNFLTEPTLFEAKVKGSSYYIYLNGKLVVDGTGKHTTAVADNSATFGDQDTTALSGADCTLMEWLIYVGEPLYQEINGCQLSEFVCWSGNQTGLADELYNSGTNLSVKQVCGISRNYLKRLEETTEGRGITLNPTTTSTAFTLMTDMEAFALCGDDVDVVFGVSIYNNNTGSDTRLVIFIDGAEVIWTDRNNTDTANYANSVELSHKLRPLVGLHKFEGKWLVSANTGTAQDGFRNLSVRS